jgi:protein-L-isoaspartate(D-aspartate) O-methyltransferase
VDSFPLVGFIRSHSAISLARPRTTRDNPPSMSQAADLAASLRPWVRDERVLRAIAEVPRERFVLAREQERAYENIALPIDYGQTISQPLVVARMLELLDIHPGDRVLDVGSGSGYHAALLAHLGGCVYGVERHPALVEQARTVLDALGIENVELFVGDGWDGLAAHAPFQAVNVAAATGSAVPEALEAQLADGGRLVAPVGERDQYLTLIVRHGERLDRARLEPVRFVPLVRG